MNDQKTVFVMVGTDHHSFQRMIDWADTWAERRNDNVIVQHGHSRAPAKATGRPFLEPAEIAHWLEMADVVVVHGGPATISDARQAGHMPIVFPRDPTYGEHVDDHQQRFARWSDHKELVATVRTVEELNVRVSALLSDTGTGTRFSAEAGPASAMEAPAQLTKELAKLRRGGSSSAADAPIVLFGLLPSNTEPLMSALTLPRPGICVLGQLSLLWSDGPIAEKRCSCGAKFDDCAFWQRVGKIAFGGWDNADVMDARQLAAELTSWRGRIASALPRESATSRRRLIRLSRYYSAIYQAARVVSGMNTLLDVDRDTARALVLSHNRTMDIRPVHLRGSPSPTNASKPDRYWSHLAVAARRHIASFVLQLSRGLPATLDEAAANSPWSAVADVSTAANPGISPPPTSAEVHAIGLGRNA